MANENTRYASPEGQQAQLGAAAIATARAAYLRGEITTEQASAYASVVSTVLPDVTQAEALTVITEPLSLADWTDADSFAASKEGWDLFECSGSAQGSPQIQRIDFPENGEPELGDDPSWEPDEPDESDGPDGPDEPDTLRELREPA